MGTTFEPYVAETDLVADLPDGRTIQVAVAGQTVTPELLRELGVVPLPRRVDEPSPNSTPDELAAAAATTQAVRDGLLDPRSELQRQGIEHPAVVNAGAEPSEVTDVAAEVRESEEPNVDEPVVPTKRAGKPRTADKPAPTA